MGKKWVPLESNPEVLNQFARTLGFDVSTYAFCDVLGLDEVRAAPWRLMVRRPLRNHMRCKRVLECLTPHAPSSM
jgi:hypothetical protein